MEEKFTTQQPFEMQNFSQMDFNHGSDTYTAKIEDTASKIRMYIRPRREFSVGSAKICTMVLSPSAPEYVLLFQCNTRAELDVIPIDNNIEVKLNGVVITTKQRVNNFGLISVCGLNFRYVTFFEDIVIQQLNYAVC
ncbi:hypothetical protein EIN_229600 [Entamoeba invadens IP1]|uniref:FHA domain-containing protein n=1 Tax=Entamoeba invadens IP1 TaxID=370355 RepID=A0A0A1U300_ENTIV|nr:hypothetical protein EIN_229600 [Entamoeba invadens IP1]ELP88427.1 hypothetical protein EIN_229600 [Entamoeba invadens IP1]|eukprot:XP_004255198.1 hypothetical protein EIN_229600 [Entamoeba invadens IP1]